MQHATPAGVPSSRLGDTVTLRAESSRCTHGIPYLQQDGVAHQCLLQEGHNAFAKVPILTFLHKQRPGTACLWSLEAVATGRQGPNGDMDLHDKNPQLKTLHFRLQATVKQAC